MRRRDFIKSTGAAALAAGTLARIEHARAADRTEAEQRLASPFLSSGTRALHLVTCWPDAASGPGDDARQLARRLAAATGDRWRIEVSQAGGSGFEAVMTGAADLYVGCETEHARHHGALAYFGGLPIERALGAHDLASWITVAGGQELWDELAGGFNVKAVLCGHGGKASSLWARNAGASNLSHPQRSAVPGPMSEVMSGLGFGTVDLAQPDMPEALASGTVDIVEVLDTSLAVEADLRARGFHRLGAGFYRSGVAYSLGMRRSFWHGLSESDRIMLSAIAAQSYAAAVANRHMDGVMRRHAPWQDARSREEHALWARSRGLREAVTAEIAGRDSLSQAIDRSYMAYRAQISDLALLMS